MPEKNDDVFDVEIRYSSTGDDKALKAAEGIDDAIESIKDNALLDLELSVTGEDDLQSIADEMDRLKSETIDTTVNVDSSELLDADRLRENLEDDTTTTANVEDSQLKEANAKLDAIKNLEILNFVWNVSGTLVDFFKSTADFTVSPLLEYDTALSTIQARTGKMLPGARELIGDLYTDGWGESRQQIADVITLATQLGVTQDKLKEATQKAFEVSAVTGDDQQTSLRSIVTLSREMGITYNHAADLIVTGSQEGANAAGDLSGTLIEFAPNFRELGLTSDQSLAILVSGMKAGAKDTATVADGVKDLIGNIGKIGTDQGVTDAFTQLDKLSTLDLKSMLDLYNQGKLSGADLLQGIFDAIAEGSAVDPNATKAAAGVLLGGKGQDVGLSIWGGLSTSFDSEMQTVEGRSTEAGKNIHDNITAKFEEVTRSIGESIASYLENDAGLDTFLNNFKTGIQDTLDALKEGKGVGEAIEIGLRPIGLDDEFDKLQSIFGDLVISFLQLVADIQDVLRKDSTGTRGTISQLSQQDLAFDLKVNPDDVAGPIETGFARGLTAPQVHEAIGTAVTELAQSGAADQAQALLDQLKNGSVTFTNVTSIATGEAFPDVKLPITPDMTPEEVEKFVAEQQAAFGNDFNFTIETIPTIPQDKLDALQATIDAATFTTDISVDKATPGQQPTAIATTPGGASTTGAPEILADTDALTAAQQRQSEAAAATATAAHDHALQETELRTAFEAANIPTSNMAVSVDEVASASADANLAQSDLGDALAQSIEDYQALEAQLATGAITLDQFNAKLQTLIDTANAAASGSGGIDTSTHNTTVNQTNNVQSNAQANAVGVVTADFIGGLP